MANLDFGTTTGKSWLTYDCGYAIRTYTTDDNGNITTDGNFTHHYQDAYFDPYEENKVVTITPVDITDDLDYNRNITLTTIHEKLHPTTNNHRHNHGSNRIPEYTNVQITSGEGLTTQELFAKYASDTYYYVNGIYGSKIQYKDYTARNDGSEQKGIVFICTSNKVTPVTATVTTTENVLTGYKCSCGATKKA